MVDDFLVAEVEWRHSECHYGSHESETPERDESNEFVREETDDERECRVVSFLGKQKTLEFEDEKVGDIGNFTEENVHGILLDLVISTRFQATT